MTEAELDACLAEMASDADYQGDAMALAQRILRSATGRLVGAENSLVVEGEIRGDCTRIWREFTALRMLHDVLRNLFDDGILKAKDPKA
jgi:hypothetical protein